MLDECLNVRRQLTLGVPPELIVDLRGCPLFPRIGRADRLSFLTFDAGRIPAPIPSSTHSSTTS
jgi:hypothetical protein